MRAQRTYADYMQLEEALSDQDYLGGKAPSLADIGAGATLFRYFEMGLPVPQPPRVIAWYERLQERPAYRQHVMTPFDELFGRADF